MTIPEYPSNTRTENYFDRWHQGVALVRWRLENFKSVKSADVLLSPLTLLVGANSAGKSSLLQSILAVTQATNTAGDRFPLNGGTVRLGTVEQNRYAGPNETEPKTISLGAQFYIGPDASASAAARMALRRRRVHFPEERTCVDWSLVLGDSPANQSGHAMIESLRVDVTHRIDDNAVGSGVMRRQSEDGSLHVFATTRGRPNNDRARIFRGTSKRGPDELEIENVVLRGGLPIQGLIMRTRSDVLWSAWVDSYLQALRTSEHRLQPATLSGQDAADHIVNDLRHIAEQHKGDDDWSVDLESIVRTELRDRLAARTETLLDANLLGQPEFRNSVISLLEKQGVTGNVPTRSKLEHVTTSVDSVLEFLRNSVRYLGPLREDPRVVYQDSPEAGNGYVGPKGEYCAAVLQNSGKDYVKVPMPGNQVGAPASRTTLTNAVNAWAAYLEIGQTVKTTDMGRLGLEVQVTQDHVNVPLDLTSVGTGVSQILPVLVMCLQAPPGALLLMEQPELHLNPRVQQRLADFLLAIATSGRQLIVETHSDYLISRLRLRVAEDDTGDVQKTVGLLFAERIEGRTNYRQVETNEFGGLDNWPANFFDQSAEESHAILRAAVRKRKVKPQDE